MEEEELAAVEEDVERKRVAKNPFGHKFTMLTESPFADPHQRGDSQQMDTISRQIIVRMEVISKQIAFLSKQTAGQPEKVLAGRGQSASSADGFQQNISANDDSRGAGTRRGWNNTSGEAPPGTSSEGGIVMSNGAPSGPPLSARVDLYRHLRQGVATAAEILPDGILSQSLKSLAAPPSWIESPGDKVSSSSTPLPSTTTAAAAATAAGEEDSSAQTRTEKSVAVSGTHVPPGILHQFIKHVRPFSVCFETPGSRMAGSSSVTPIDPHGGGATKVTGLSDGVKPLGTGNLDGFGQIYDDGDGMGSGTEMPINAVESVNKNTGAEHDLPARTPNRFDDMDSSRECDDNGKPGDQPRGRTGGDLGAPRKPAIPERGSEALRRAKARLQGKRKLAYSAPTSTDISNDGTGQAASPTATKDTPMRKNSASRTIAQGVPHCQTKEARVARADAGNNAHDNTGGWLSLSWKGAKELRKRMESAAARDERPTAGAAGKKSRRGGRKGGAVQVTLPCTTAGATPSGIEPLSFVSSKVHVDIPEVTDAKDYLLSVANPVRDIAAIKRAFQEQPRSLSKELVCSPESPIRPPIELDRSDSDSYDFALENNETFQDQENHPSSVKAEHLRPEYTKQPKADPSAAPKRSSKGDQNVKSGTCVIDLKNIWQRTGAISHTISQTIKASEERTSLANGLRESFGKLDLQRRLKDEQTQEVLSCDSNDGGRHTSSTGGTSSMSVSLGYPPQDGRNAAGASPSKPFSGDIEGAARMFALVVSLAHVHNVSGPHVAADTHGGRSATGANVASSQLHVELGSGGKEAIVTACGK